MCLDIQFASVIISSHEDDTNSKSLVYPSNIDKEEQ